MKWLKTENRFIAFFDILGFKELVMRSSHAEVLLKLEGLKQQIYKLENKTELSIFGKRNFEVGQTKSVTFSDSIIVFSNSDSLQDAIKILYDAYFILKYAFESRIAIKGAISYGAVTVDLQITYFLVSQ